MTVIPIQERVPVRITPRGARFFELVRNGYEEVEAMRIAAREHGPKLVEAPARQDAGETETQTAQQLRDRIEKQIAAMLAAGRELLQAARVSKARSEFLEASRKPGSGGTVQ